MGHSTYRGPDAYHSDEDHDRMKDMLLEAEAIKKDPKVMNRIHEKLGETKKAIHSISALRKAAADAPDDSGPMEEDDGADTKNKTKAKKVRERSDREDQPG